MPRRLTYIYKQNFETNSGSDPINTQQSPTIHQLLSILSNFQSYLNDSLPLIRELLHDTFILLVTHLIDSPSIQIHIVYIDLFTK